MIFKYYNTIGILQISVIDIDCEGDAQRLDNPISTAVINLYLDMSSVYMILLDYITLLCSFELLQFRLMKISKYESLFFGKPYISSMPS